MEPQGKLFTRGLSTHLLLSRDASLAAKRMMRSSLVPMGNQQEAMPDTLAASISLLISSKPRLSAHCLSSCLHTGMCCQHQIQLCLLIGLTPVSATSSRLSKLVHSTILNPLI